MKKLLVFVLVATLLTLVGCNNGITSVESGISYENYESDAKKQEMMQLEYDEVNLAFYVNESRDIEGKTLYVLLQDEISPRIFKYTAADFGITDVSTIKEIKDLGLSEWKYDPYELGEEFRIRRELQIILSESNKDYLFELAKKVFELPFVYGVSVDYEDGPYTDYNFQKEACQTIIKKEFPDFVNIKQAKQYMMQREYSDTRNLFCDYSDNICGKELSISLPRDLSLWEFEYTAADFGITDTSKIKEIESYDLFDKSNAYYHQVISIILKEKDVDYLIELAKKVYEKPFVARVSLDYYDEYED